MWKHFLTINIIFFFSILASEVSVYGEDHHEQDTSYVNGSGKHIQKTHSHATNLQQKIRPYCCHKQKPH